MIYGITYTDENMTISAEKCRLSMLKNGCDEAMIFNDVDCEFKLLNTDIFQSGARGAGCYWLFKPYVIYRTLLDVNITDGDILIYSDAGVEFVNSVHEIINKMDEDIFLFTNGFLQKEWCKGDIMNQINRVSDYDSFNYKQVQASVIFFKVAQKTRDFVKEWLLWCQFPGFIDDTPSKFQNCKTFAENRHDQAILTALQIKYSYKLHFWPTNYSEHIRYTAQPEDNYPVLFNHHRKRNSEW